MITFIPEYNAGGLGYITTGKESQISYDKIKTDADRARFLSQFGWEISATPIESAEITIPDQFDKIFTGYNEIQKRQGLDLSKYKRKKVMRYTYEITNYEGRPTPISSSIATRSSAEISARRESTDLSTDLKSLNKKTLAAASVFLFYLSFFYLEIFLFYIHRLVGFYKKLFEVVVGSAYLASNSNAYLQGVGSEFLGVFLC